MIFGKSCDGSPVGESAHADPDSLEHTVAGQLVHDQWRLHIAGLLMGVGHQATDKVRLARVKCAEQKMISLQIKSV